MTGFLLACLAFLAAHVAPAATGLRGRLVARWGRARYLAVYSVLSLALLGWVIAAALRAPHVELWAPSRALALVPFALMPTACLLLVMGAGRANPASVSFLTGEARGPGITALIRHPILWAFALWAIGHLAANGDLVAALLFGGAALFAFAGMAALTRRARRRGDLAALAVAEGSLGARLGRAADPRLAVEAVAGLVLFFVLLALHGPVIGVDPRAWI